MSLLFNKVCRRSLHLGGLSTTLLTMICTQFVLHPGIAVDAASSDSIGAGYTSYANQGIYREAKINLSNGTDFTVTLYSVGSFPSPQTTRPSTPGSTNTYAPCNINISGNSITDIFKFLQAMMATCCPSVSQGNGQDNGMGNTGQNNGMGNGQGNKGIGSGNWNGNGNSGNNNGNNNGNSNIGNNNGNCNGNGNSSSGNGNGFGNGNSSSGNGNGHGNNLPLH